VRPATAPSSARSAGDGTNTKLLLIAGAAAVVLVLVAGVVLLAGSGEDSSTDAQTAATSDGADTEDVVEMCRNPSVARGEPYERAPGLHGAKAFLGSGSGAFEEEPLPDGWERSRTELVACATRTEAMPAGQCTLSSGPGSSGRLFQMHATRWSVVVYDAGTGAALATATLDGSDTTCPSVAIIKPNQTDLYADPQGLDEMLRSYVEVPDETGTVPLGRPAPLPSDLPPACPAPPFEVTVADGPDAQTLSVPGAVAIENTKVREAQVEVWLAGFPFSADDLSADDPPFAGRGTWAILHFSRDGGSIDHDTLTTGDVVPHGASPAGAAAPYGVVPVVQPNSFAERKNANPTAAVEPAGSVTIVHADDRVVCLEMALTSNLGASVSGRITATRS
jgi:hypothetical protein